MLAISLANLLILSSLTLKSSKLVVPPESMHLNALVTSAVLPLLVAAQLINVFHLVVETQETELIQTVSLNSLCQR